MTAIGSTDPLIKQAKALGISSVAIDRAAEIQAHSQRARLLAREGKLVDAEAAFEEAIAVANRERARASQLRRSIGCVLLLTMVCADGPAPRRTTFAGAVNAAGTEEGRAGWLRHARTQTLAPRLDSAAAHVHVLLLHTAEAAHACVVCPGRGGEVDERIAVVEDPFFAVDGVHMGAPIAELDALTELDAEEVLRGDRAARLAEEARLAREAQVRVACLFGDRRPCCRRWPLLTNTVRGVGAGTGARRRAVPRLE